MFDEMEQEIIRLEDLYQHKKAERLRHKLELITRGRSEFEGKKYRLKNKTPRGDIPGNFPYKKDKYANP